ncbi:MAG: PIN domain-containing protein [candidate division WOR-3 bacterium]|nr:PIN domain-containing protein [candidate division WOR-3 bacterium]
MTSKTRLYWDSSIFLAWLKGEIDCGADVLGGIAELVEQIENDDAVLITSILTKAEILRGTLSPDAKSKLDGMLRRRNVVVHETNQWVWEMCHHLRDFYRQANHKDDLPTLTVPDAIHIATALLYSPCEFYTLDALDKHGRYGRRALVPLSGTIAGKYPLTIRKPMVRKPTLF